MNDDAQRALDGLLITLVQGGSDAAFERLARRWTPKLLRYATRVLGHPDSARDIVQETWIGVMRGLGRLDDPSQFPAWIYSITHRKCVDGIRANQRARRLAQRIAREPTAAEPVGQEEFDPGDRPVLTSAVARLSEEQRDAVYLFYGEELGIPEIAIILNVPAGTVKSRLHHARENLKRHLGE